MKKKIVVGIIAVVVLIAIAVAGLVAYRFVGEMKNRGADYSRTEKSDGVIDVSGFIGEEKAKEIALAKAELTADRVKFVRTELDRDNGIWQYEVEFRDGLTEYDVDIKADDGTILKWDIDYDD